MGKMKFYNSVAAFADKFDGFIIDLWGVLHDGETAYPGAVDTLQKLKGQGKRIILLSNAPRQARKAKEVLDNLGFTDDLYDYLLTSGQVTHDYLRDKGSGIRDKGKRYYYIGPEKDKDLIADLAEYEMVDDPAKAEFVIAAGFDGPGEGFETKQAQIDECLKNDLLLICPNPDRKVVKQDGRVWLCAGLIYDYYVEKGGKALIFGKPYPGVYEECVELFKQSAVSYQPSAICAIGDSLHTDIAGANNAGIYSVLCAGGILADDMGIKPGQMPTKEALQKLCDRDKTIPAAVIPHFVW